MRDEFIDRLSEYLDDELTREERDALEAHVTGCPKCAATLTELKRVIERGRTLGPRPPEHDLWPAIAGRIAPPSRYRAPAWPARTGESRQFSFTLAQLAAAAVVLIALSSAVAWRLAERAANDRRGTETTPAARVAEVERAPSNDAADSAALVRPVSLADAQYDAAVTDLEQALAKGRGRLDKTTIAIVEENLNIIDQAIAQARTALASDPANAYLSSHLVEARRKKLDLLRRAAALTETN